MTLYTGNPKESTKKLLKVINEFSNNKRHKIYTYIHIYKKTIVFLYTCSEQYKNKIKKQFCLQQQKELLGIHLMKV